MNADNLTLTLNPSVVPLALGDFVRTCVKRLSRFLPLPVCVLKHLIWSSSASQSAAGASNVRFECYYFMMLLFRCFVISCCVVGSCFTRMRFSSFHYHDVSFSYS